MKGADKVICQAAAVLLLFAVSSASASAQMGFGGGGGEDMMTQTAPMLEMMKARMGKRRFAMLMQTIGPMMGQMMEGGGSGGFGGITGGGGFGGMGGMIPDGMGGGDIMSMIGPMMRMANFGGGFGGGHLRHRRHY